MALWNTSVSTLLIASYVVDWLVIITTFGVGAAVSSIKPNERPFSLVSTEISYPYVAHETISLGILVVVSLLVPAAIILLLSLVLVPRAIPSNEVSLPSRWTTKLWELHTGWLGLALSLATAFFFTNGMKNLFGKPRPDLISRCSPDFSQLRKYVVGGVGDSLPEGTSLVSAGICETKGSILEDGFRSFPSGHSSFSFAGLGYLTLFICSKCRIALPIFPPHSVVSRSTLGRKGPMSRSSQDGRQESDYSDRARLGRQDEASLMDRETKMHRHKAAAPPIYLWFVAVVPVAAAVYISSTRFSDFRHHGFDILFGSLMGIISAWFSFLWYHMPISSGDGWSWAPRNRSRAFGAGVGSNGYGDYDSWSKRRRGEDLESGSRTSARGLTDTTSLTNYQHVPSAHEIELSNVSGFR